MTASHEDRYRTLFERAPIGILYADPDSTYVDANAHICALLGYTRAELVGMHASEIVAADEVAHIDPAPGDTQGPDGHRREWTLRRNDGSTFPADVVATTLPDGTRLAMIRDVTESRSRERLLARTSRLYAALSQVNLAIVAASARDDLFHRVCEALVDRGGFRMASVSWQDAETNEFQRVARCGDEGDPDASVAFPILVAGTVRGTLTVGAGQADAFHHNETALLAEAAADLSFALDNLARDDARREAERIARDEQQFADTMIESMPGIVYFYDASLRFRRWNRNMEAATGYTAAQIAVMHPLDFIAEDDRARVEQRIAEVFDVGEAAVEAVLVARDGRRSPYHFTGRRVQFEGQTCLIGVGVDITAQKAGEGERDRRQRAESADRIKSVFLATMSHELRTPLNSIIGFTGVLLQGLPGPLNAEQRKQLGMVRSSARHLLALVNDVLDISKIEAGQLAIAPEAFEAPRAIARVVDLVSPASQKTGVPLRVTVAPEVGSVVADQRRVEQVLLNLLGNALKFTDRGEIHVAADVVCDLPSAAHPAGRPCLRVRVIDTGIGIRREDLPTLFQPFRQIESGLSRRYEGTGLGLAICVRLAHLMGGRLDADSQWGEGSTFVLTVPLEPDTQ